MGRVEYAPDSLVTISHQKPPPPFPVPATMPARYARVPNPSSSHDLEEELEAAFELNDDDDDEDSNDRNHTRSRSQALPIRTTTTNVAQAPANNTGGYDFERQDYDFPPPGSPPAPTARALPNDIGNSNGVLPVSPVTNQPPQPSFFRRAVGALLPTHYTRVATSEPNRRVGGGTENDGVFANVMAKPQAGKVVRTEDGNVYVVPEDSQKELPPVCHFSDRLYDFADFLPPLCATMSFVQTYAEAQADAVPPYWETTIHAPASLDPSADMIIDDLPTGTFIVFGMNFIISSFFQFVGFFLTYMLHTSHAAKFGSRAGLGLTLIQYGFYSRAVTQEQEDAQAAASGWNYPLSNNSSSPAFPEQGAGTPQDISHMSQTSRDWLSFLFMTLGSWSHLPRSPIKNKTVIVDANLITFFQGGSSSFRLALDIGE